jgi:hypothetical protein
MIGLAIGILWFALGVIILGGVIWLALWGIKQFVSVPARLETAVWIVFFILCLIYLLYALESGGLPSPHLMLR